MTGNYTHTSVPHQTKRRSRVLGLVLAAIVLIGGGAAVGVYLLARHTGIVDALSPNMTVTGTVELELDDMVNWGTACAGKRGFSDLKIGAPVVITDAAGKTIAMGQIGGAKEIGGRCILAFRIEDVPKGSDFYGVTVSHRGTVQYTADEVKQTIKLSLN